MYGADLNSMGYSSCLVSRFRKDVPTFVHLLGHFIIICAIVSVVFLLQTRSTSSV